MFPSLNIGGLVLPTAGLVYILGAWLVLSVIERAAKALDLDAESTYGLAAISLAASFIGARILFVIFHWSAFQQNLIGIVWPLTSGYHFGGGLFFGALAGILYGRAKQLPLSATLDALAPGLLVASIVVSLADFLGGPGYGIETSIPWGIDVFGIQRHPVQFYEIVIALAGLLVWWWGFKHRRQEGQMFLMTLIIYATGRLIVDAFRANSPLTESGYHIVQIGALSVVLVSGYLLSRMMTQSDEHEVAELS
jgi:phosphatidylglycerol:prolipoprotein diacylglycerol transferase